jgi:hypothetical protein
VLSVAPQGTVIPHGGSAEEVHVIYRWDPVTGEQELRKQAGGPAYFVASHVDTSGVPSAFLLIVDSRKTGHATHVERWRLDTLELAGPPLPVTLSAVFDKDGATWMVLAEPDGSLIITPLPPFLEEC